MLRTLFQHHTDDEFAASVLADLKAAGRFAFELIALLVTLFVGGALILFAL